MTKLELEKENNRLKFLLENHKEFLEKKDNDIEELKKENLQLKAKNESFAQERRTLELCIESRNKTIDSLEKEIVGRVISDLRNGAKAKREKGEVIYKDELNSDWYKLFLELPSQTRNRIIAEAETHFDEKQAFIPPVKEYLMKNVHLPRVLYEKGFFPICEASRIGNIKRRIGQLKVVKEKIKSDYLKTKETIKKLESELENSEYHEYCETAARSHEGIE